MVAPFTVDLQSSVIYRHCVLCSISVYVGISHLPKRLRAPDGWKRHGESSMLLVTILGEGNCLLRSCIVSNSPSARNLVRDSRGLPADDAERKRENDNVITLRNRVANELLDNADLKEFLGEGTGTRARCDWRSTFFMNSNWHCRPDRFPRTSCVSGARFLGTTRDSPYCDCIATRDSCHAIHRWYAHSFI